jgi:hypothetical protein
MLGYYAGRYPTVEINNTFYRLPKEHVLQDWASQVHDRFTFSIKASQRITHYARLKPESASALEFLLKNTATLGTRLGPILFQLPPNLPKNLERLQAFLALLPTDRRFTIEFRHESWFDEDVFSALRSHDVALCVAESEEFVARTSRRHRGGTCACIDRITRIRCWPSGRRRSMRTRGATRMSSSSTTTSMARARSRSSGSRRWSVLLPGASERQRRGSRSLRRWAFGAECGAPKRASSLGTV